MDNIELNFQNYNLEDILNLYKISNNITEDDIIDSKKTLLQLKTAKVDDEVYSLFNKCYSVIQCVYKYRDYMKLTRPDYVYTSKDDEEFVRSVKLVPEFEKYNNVLDIVHSIVKTSLHKSDIDEKIKERLLENADVLYNVKNPHPQNPNPLPKLVDTFENKIVPGDINSIRRNTQLVNLHINSCFRENYYKTNPCNYKYSVPPISNLVSMKLASIELPNAWFLFSHLKKNNTFTVETTLKGKCSIHSIVIPDGNYDKDTLTNYLNTKYFHNSDRESPLQYIKYSIHPFTNKSRFEIVENTPEDFLFSLHFAEGEQDNILETCGWLLGFRLARYLKIEDAVFSEGLFDAGGDRYVYLAINDYQYNYNETNIVCFDKMTINEYIIAKIPLRNGKLSLIIDENDKNPLVKIRRYNGPVNLSKFEIKLLDKFGDVIDFNHMDWSFTLELEVLYENTLKN
tara:strand:+ start:51 stop:1415 length:1365 start_codon:yes stop_codon:yes gene_type:complete